MKRVVFILFFSLIWFFQVFGQDTRFSILGSKAKERISFKLVNNLIIIPVEVNGMSLSFLLDSGVSTPILFGLEQVDSMDLKEVEEVSVRGFGGGVPIKALHAHHNQFQIGKTIYNGNLDMYVVLDQNINFSPRLGVPVHGIIGADLFKDFIVEVNYSSKKLYFHEPDEYRYDPCSSCESYPLEIVGNKPYITVDVHMQDGNNLATNLLIDSGSSDALWLFCNENKGLKVPNKNFDDFLGFGLSGGIYGKRSRVGLLKIGLFELPEAKVAFPDSTALQYINTDHRSGTLGAEVLRRFNVIMDYPNKKITLKKNRYFSDPFTYNMSGLELQHNGIRIIKELDSRIGTYTRDDRPNSGLDIVLTRSYLFNLVPAMEVAEVRKNSPAHLAGVLPGDTVLKINGKSVYRYELQEVVAMLQDKEGKNIHLLVERNGKELFFDFKLKKLL